MFIRKFKFNFKYILIIIILAVIFDNFIVLITSLFTLQKVQSQTQKFQEKKIFDLTNKEYRKKIVFDLKNNETLKDFQIFLKLDTLSLIKEGKLSFDCGNLRFTDSDGKTEIPYWIKSGCGENDTQIWLRIPEITPRTKKTIYVYYDNAYKPSASNFDNVFITNNNLMGWYFFDNLKVITDLSMNKNNANTIGLDYEMISPEMKLEDCENRNRCFAYLDNWGYKDGWTDRPDAYFEIPSKGLNFDKSQGSIEMWIKPDNVKSGKYQRLIIDTNWDIELGINPYGDLYFYPAQAPKNNYNLIKNPLKNNKWNHIVVTWNFNNKEVNFYINGEKKKNDVNNVSKYWKRIARTGDWRVGGTSLNWETTTGNSSYIETAFVGYIDGLRIYSKALNNQEIKAAYRYNGSNLRYPTIFFGEEELISEEKQINQDFDLSTIKNINLTDKINISSCYVWPFPYYTEWKYIDPLSNEYLFLESKNPDPDYYSPIFGVESHFFPYEGTPVKFKDHFLLLYVGLEINNPQLVKDIKISFSKYYSYEDEYRKGKINKYFEKLIPKSYACGPYGNYKLIGSSELSLIGEKDGVYWYALRDPIFFDKEESVMQLSYKPTGEEGKLSIRVADMVFIDKDKKFVRPSLLKYTDIVLPYIFDEGSSNCSPYNKYLVYLAKEEKGNIVFRQNSDMQTLDLSFENIGKDSITIDNQSIWNIKNKSISWIVKDIKIQDSSGNIISKISLDEIKNKILGKQIETNQSIKIPIVSLKDLQKNKFYYIVIGTGGEYKGEKITNQNRIIKWSFVYSPYYYPQFYKDDNLYIYRIKITQDDSIIFDEIR
jgi:hypothetical protein